MPSPNPPPFFRCPSCNALYQLVKAEAGPETVALEIACSVCSRPLVAREGQFVLKYFLLRKERRFPPPLVRSTKRSSTSLRESLVLVYLPSDAQHRTADNAKARLL
jgi:hypothetical protein